MKDMVKHLHSMFLERCRNNERYSLRAFAKSLSIPPSSLSEIINGKRPLTPKLRDKIGRALDMSPEEIKAYSARPHGNSSGDFKESKETPYAQLALDSFYIISEWYHYGILQLLRTKGFKNNPQWIAKRLGINPIQAKLAVERLIRVGILEEGSKGQLKDITNGSTTHLINNFSNEELRSFQIKALEKAIGTMREVPVTLRDNTSMTMAVSKKALPFAKKEITKFRRELTKKLEAYAAPDEVYQLAISFTPLTKIEIKKEERKK